MRYSVLVIESKSIFDYCENSAEGIRYDNLSKSELDILIKLSLKQNFSIVILECYEENIE